MNHSEITERILEIYDLRGAMSYGENVTELEHALQSAHAAATDQADEPLIIASLLHDIGHLLHDLGEDIAERGFDALHEDLGAVWLSQYFGPRVTEPVRKHVASKRYLCTVEHGYTESLSPASYRSYLLQGGPMTPAEVAHFEANPHWKECVRLRRYDDTGKDPALKLPAMSTYRDMIKRVLSTCPPVQGSAAMLG